jgi:hypothetical protein
MDGTEWRAFPAAAALAREGVEEVGAHPTHYISICVLCKDAQFLFGAPSRLVWTLCCAGARFCRSQRNLS